MSADMTVEVPKTVEKTTIEIYRSLYMEGPRQGYEDTAELRSLDLDTGHFHQSLGFCIFRLDLLGFHQLEHDVKYYTDRDGLFLHYGKLSMVDDHLDVAYRDDGVTIGDIDRLIHISDEYLHLVHQPPSGSFTVAIYFVPEFSTYRAAKLWVAKAPPKYQRYLCIAFKELDDNDRELVIRDLAKRHIPYRHILTSFFGCHYTLQTILDFIIF
jgi:hypothetical protein